MSRGTSNGNVSGNSEDRRRRKLWLLNTYRADCDGEVITDAGETWVEWVPLDHGIPVCRCYRCGKLLTLELMTVDRIIPGCKGGKYVRNNIRPACSGCNELTGGQLAMSTKHACRICAQEDPHDKRRPRPLVHWSGESLCATHTNNGGRRAKWK